MGEVAGRAISIGVSAFLLFAVLALGWSAGQLLVGIWLQTTVLWVLVALGGVVVAARVHWAVLLIALPLGAFAGFVTAKFVDFFGMFAWAAWAAEQGVKVRMLSFNPFRNSWHFLQRTPEVLPLWQIAVLVGLQVAWTLAVLVAPRERMAQGFRRLFEDLQRLIFVNHFAILVGGALAVYVSGSQALLFGLLGLLLLIDGFRLMRALRAAGARRD